jgi:hypothetical protein
MEEKISATNVEMSVITTADKKFTVATKEELEEVILTLKPDLV